MSDITKCNGKNCKLKENCFRYVSKANKYQSYFGNFEELYKDGRCDYYWEIIPDKKVND